MGGSVETPIWAQDRHKFFKEAPQWPCRTFLKAYVGEERFTKVQQRDGLRK